MQTCLMLVLALALSAASPAGSQTLRVGLSAEPSSADPHHYALTPNSTLRSHLFDGLTDVDARLRVGPGLAESWEREDDRTWLFRLRRGVRFSDGAAFGAPDAVFTFCRALNNKDELVSSFSRVPRRLEAVEARGEDTLVIRTREPEPRFDAASACGGEAAGPWPTQADFNEGRAAIGTGPYRLASFSRGGAVVLARNEGYWGPRPHWAAVRLTPVAQNGPRMAALLAGDQDLIEAPATADLPRLRADRNFAVSTSPTTRLIFLQLDAARDPSPFVAGRNALRDPRVRRALSLALDRGTLRERIMDGVATAAAQFLPDGMGGTIPGLPVLPYDPARAKALLAEAGYAEGLSLTFHATNNRYVNDGRLAQAIVQQWQRVGVRAELEAMPAVSFFARRGKRDFSVAMGGWGTEADETLNFFRTWLITTDAPRGLGTSNYGGWSDPAFDRSVGDAMAEMNPEPRAALLRAAGERALDQMPVIPLHFESAVWAMRAGLRYTGRVDQTTLATEVSPR